MTTTNSTLGSCNSEQIIHVSCNLYQSYLVTIQSPGQSIYSVGHYEAVLHT